MSFIAKQPNGKYCRFSSVVDSVTHYNFTKEQYIDGITNTTCGRENRIRIMERNIQPFSQVIESCKLGFDTAEELEELFKAMEVDGDYKER